MSLIAEHSFLKGSICRTQLQKQRSSQEGVCGYYRKLCGSGCLASRMQSSFNHSFKLMWQIFIIRTVVSAMSDTVKKTQNNQLSD